MRLFIAVRPPHRVLTALDAAVGPARRHQTPRERIRWVPPDNWHLTLAFLGSVKDSTLPGLCDRLQRAAARHRPMEIRLEGVTTFGSRRQARVLFAGVAGEVEPLRRLAWSVAAAARRQGIPVEDRRFRPHLTLARLRQPADLRDLVETIDDGLDPTTTCWSADRICLMQTTPGVGPGVSSSYDVVDSWPLGG